MIKVGFYNLENLFLTQEVGLRQPRKPVEKCRALAKTILEMDLDILAVCEVGGKESLQSFSEQFLQGKYNSSLIEGNSDRDIHLGYLIKKDLPYKFEHLTHRNRSLNFWYPKEASENKEARKKGKKRPHRSELLSRDIAELRVLNDKDEVILDILAVHLKSQLDSEGKDWRGKNRRKAELNLLVKTWEVLQSRYPEQPILVLGDFNGNASLDGDEEFKDLYAKTPLQDIHEFLKTRKEDRFTWMGFDNQNQPVHTQLDFAFIDPKFENRLVKENCGTYRYRGENGNPLPLPQNPWQRHPFPSDHLPIVISLNLI